MARTINSLGMAARHRLILRVECRSCGNRQEFYASDLAFRLGEGRDPFHLKFRCKNCRPPIRITLIQPPDPKPAPKPSDPGETLRTKAAKWEGLSVYCGGLGCAYGGEADMLELARHLGPDHGSLAHDLRGVFFCPRCRASGRPDNKITFTMNSDHAGYMRRREKPEPNTLLAAIEALPPGVVSGCRERIPIPSRSTTQV